MPHIKTKKSKSNSKPDLILPSILVNENCEILDLDDENSISLYRLDDFPLGDSPLQVDCDSNTIDCGNTKSEEFVQSSFELHSPELTSMNTSESSSSKLNKSELTSPRITSSQLASSTLTPRLSSSELTSCELSSSELTSELASRLTSESTSSGLTSELTSSGLTAELNSSRLRSELTSSGLASPDLTSSILSEIEIPEPSNYHKLDFLTKLDCIQSRIGDDCGNPDKSFFMGLLPELGGLTSDKKRSFKMKLTQLLNNMYNDGVDEAVKKIGSENYSKVSLSIVLLV